MLEIEFWRTLWSRLPQWLEFLAPGLLVTVELTLIAVGGALALGTIIALGRFSRSLVLRGLLMAYVEIFRGVPGLVTIYVVYFSLPAIGLYFSSFTAAAIALVLAGSAYASEIIRGSVAAIHHGHFDAAKSLGLPQSDIARFIVLPLAFRIAFPSLGPLAVTQLQYTSLASVIATAELTNRGYEIGALTFLFMQVFIVVGVLYLVLSLPLFYLYIRGEVYLSRGQVHA